MNARHFFTVPLLLVAAVVTTASSARPAAAQPAISVEQVSCLRFGANQVIYSSTMAEPPGATARLYFQWTEHPHYYWVDSEREGMGRYWGITPKPETRNTQVEYYGVLLDAVGHEITRSAMRKAKVTADCKVELTPQQLGAASNLTIGETMPDQQKKRVLGFLCDGIVTRVDPRNIKRADEICRSCVVAWWTLPQVLVPAGAAAAGITTAIVDQPEPSPSRP
jgi:hypothetical protein